nr:hypothetical protein [Candidatus Njordarchaeota archaeon]
MPEEEPLRLKLKKMEDLVMMVSSPMAPSFLCHVEKAGKHIYFAVIPVMEKPIVCYVEVPPVKKRYAVLNLITHEVSFSDDFTTDPARRHILIIEVAEQNLIK